MSGGGSNTISTQTVPNWLQPYYTGLLQQGQGLENEGGPQYYTGQTVAPLSSQQTQGISDISNIASLPNASTGAQGANEFETSGALLNPESNPYLQGTFTEAAQGVQNQLASEFGANGSNVINSLPVQSDEMNNLATQLFGGAYQSGVNTMTQASALAPSIDAGTYLPGMELMNAGSTLQSQQQALDTAAQTQWNYNQQLPYNMANWYSSLLTGSASPFSSGSSSSTQGSNSTATDVGAGVTAAGALASLYSSGALSSLAGLLS